MKKRSRTVVMEVLWLTLLAVAVSGFEVGKEYVYRQKGTLHIGNPEKPFHLSGLAFRSKVIVQPKAGHTVFKIEEIEIGKSEPLWVRNVKKGVLSLFQLDLVKGRHEHQEDNGYHVKEDGLHGPCDTLYIVHEEDHGHIEVTKVKNLDKCDHEIYASYGRQKRTVCVNCEAQRTQRPELETAAPPLGCGPAPAASAAAQLLLAKAAKTHQLSATSEVYYDLKGTAQHYVIEHAWAESIKLLKGHGEGKEFHVMLNQTLDLEQEHDAGEDIVLAEGDIEKEHSLAQEFPVARDLKDHEELKHLNGFFAILGRKPNKDSFVDGLRRLAQLEYTDEGIKEIDIEGSGGKLFFFLFSSFSAFDYEHINDVYRNHVVTAPDDIKESILHVFLDLLASVGLNPHIAFGLALIKNNEVSQLDAHYFYNKVQLNLKEASAAVINDISDSCKTESVKSYRGAWSVCKLAASAIAGGNGCKHSHDDHEEDKGTCRPEIVSHFFNYSVTPKDVEQEPEHETTVFLRVAGNLGTRKAVRYLERFISPKWHANERKRMAALWSLKQASKHHHTLARSIALPVFHNTSEPSEIRSAALVVILATNPDLYVLRHIALEVVTDPSDQVAALVTSAFRSLAESKYPCHRELAQHLRYVLPLWDNVPRFRNYIDMASSHLVVSSGYNPKYDFGGMTLSGMIRSRDSYLPRNLYVSMLDYRAGHTHHTLAFSFESWGMDKLFNLLVGPQPGSTKSIWNFAGRRRFPRDASAEERKHIDDALPIADREYDQIYAHATMTVFGNTVETIDIDEAIVGALQAKVSSGAAPDKAPASEHRQKFFLMPEDWTFVMPTELGVPLFFEHKEINFVYTKHHKVGLTHGDNAEINVDIKRHYLLETDSHQLVGLVLDFTKSITGTGYDANTVISWPLDLKATLAPLQGKLSLHRPLHLPCNAARHRFEPFTFHAYYAPALRIVSGTQESERSQKPLYHPEELLHFDRNYFGDVFGVSLNVKGHLLKKGLQSGLHEFFKEMTWRDRYYYVTINPHWHPRDVSIYILPAAEDPTKEVDVDISYKFLEPDDERHSRFQVHDKIGDDPEVPSTHVVSLDVSLKGDTRERKVAAELRHSFNHDLFNHKMQFFYERTPFRKDDHEGLKICADVSAKFPRPDWSRSENLATFHHGQHVNARLDVHYGSSCEGQSSITIDGNFTQTDDDENQLAAAAEGRPLNRGEFQSSFLHNLALKCRDDQSKGIHFSYDCFKLLVFSSRLGKLTADVEYKNYKPLYSRLFPYHARYPALHPTEDSFLRTLRENFRGENGKLHVVSQVPWWTLKEKPHTYVTITHEDGHSVRYPDVPVFSHLLEPTIYSEMGHSNLAKYSDLYKHKYCDLQSHSVRTFDGTLVDLPETDCWKVVSRDCSPNKRFVILARATGNPSLSKALKVFIHTTKVEILPESENGGLIVRVDGTTVELTDERPYSHSYHDAELFRVKTSHMVWFTLESEPYGIYVVYNGNMLLVQAARFYRGKLCGLCGDYNLDRYHELSGPDGHLYNSTLEFAKSYVVPSPDCHAPAH
ncbi:hypothetical protein V5799_028410 [Amblyomma americanum]|uniref:Vitellogenin-2 n=1 Tax=Amblyomma americanum TaxID=6943 RepID=A0AAQ4DCY3_AMBAM